MIDTLIAVEQARDGIILSVGKNVDEAIARASERLCREFEYGDFDWPGGHTDNDFRLAPCTPALAEEVSENDGQIKYSERDDGTLCLPEER